MEIAPGARPYANLAQPNNLATLLLFGVAVSLHLYSKQVFHPFTAGILIFFIYIGIVVTQSRTAILGLFVLLVFWVFFGLLKSTAREPWRRAFESLILLLMFLGMTLLLPVLQQLILLQGESMLTRGAISTQRLLIWEQLTDAALRRPWLGYGFNNVGEAMVLVSADYPESIYTEYAHNLFLDLIIWFGMPIGGLVSLGLLYWLFTRIRACGTLEQWLGLAIILVFGVHSMLEMPHAYAYFLVPVAIMAGVVDRDYYRHRPSTGKTMTIPGWALWPLGAAGLAMCAFTLVEYLKIEQAHRDMRFATARIGPLQENVVVPQSYLFPELTDFIRFARFEATEHMSQKELDWMRRVAHNKAFPPSLFRYALALGLNHQPEAAELELRRLRSLHGPKHYEEARAAWEGLTQKYPQLASVRFVSPPPNPEVTGGTKK